MILGITTESWIDTLGFKVSDAYLKYVDKIIVVSSKDQYEEDPYYYVKGDYNEVHELLTSLALCKAYSQKTLFSANFSVVELTGKTPTELGDEWRNEIKQRHLVY